MMNIQDLFVMRPFRDAGGSLIDLFIFLLYISFFALLFYLLFAGLVLAKVVIGDTGGGGGGGICGSFA